MSICAVPRKSASSLCLPASPSSRGLWAHLAGAIRRLGDTSPLQDLCYSPGRRDSPGPAVTRLGDTRYNHARSERCFRSRHEFGRQSCARHRRLTRNRTRHRDELAKDGAKVVLNYARDAEGAQAGLAEIQAAGGQGCVIQADVSDYKAAERLIISHAMARQGTQEVRPEEGAQGAAVLQALAGAGGPALRHRRRPRDCRRRPHS